VLNLKCEEAEAWKAKADHLEQHMSHFRATEKMNGELERRIEHLLYENQKLN
jgi:hypothetical protein